MLTDSGGFQIQSLPDVKVVDEGVIFNGKMFTPKDSMDIQMCLGADIMMQLDDVVNPMMPRELHERAIIRSIEWLDRAIIHINQANQRDEKDVHSLTNQDSESDANDTQPRRKAFKANKDAPTSINEAEEDAVDVVQADKPKEEIPQIKCHNGQVIFPIIQGGLDDDLRIASIKAILQRKPVGLAIGGLSGGEDKNEFCRTVFCCCQNLPEGMPRYLMGVGYPEDVVVCCALGTDMSDCVYPTRTARFGRAFDDEGDILINNSLIYDESALNPSCKCETCVKYTRAYLATIKGTPMFCMLMSLHNLHYMRSLTQRIRESIERDAFPAFIRDFMIKRYKSEIPEWIVTSLKLVKVDLAAQ